MLKLLLLISFLLVSCILPNALASEWCTFKQHMLCPNYCCRDEDDHRWEEQCCNDCTRSVSLNCPTSNLSLYLPIIIIVGVTVVGSLIAVCCVCAIVGNRRKAAHVINNSNSETVIYNTPGHRPSQFTPTAPQHKQNEAGQYLYNAAPQTQYPRGYGATDVNYNQPPPPYNPNNMQPPTYNPGSQLPYQ